MSFCQRRIITGSVMCTGYLSFQLSTEICNVLQNQWEDAHNCLSRWQKSTAATTATTVTKTKTTANKSTIKLHSQQHLLLISCNIDLTSLQRMQAYFCSKNLMSEPDVQHATHFFVCPQKIFIAKNHTTDSLSLELDVLASCLLLGQ